LTTSTIKDGDLETRLAFPGMPSKTIHTTVGTSWNCEEAISSDGTWLATVISTDKLTVQVIDLRSRELHRQYSSEWHTFHGMKLEPGYRAPFLGGFSADDSLVLWRYVPEKRDAASNASAANLHLQRWSVDGELIADDDLGVSGFGGAGREPISADGLHRLWIPGGCGIACYRGVSVDQGHVHAEGSLTIPFNDASVPIDIPTEKRLLSVAGERTDQKAVLLDYSGRIDSEVNLPFFPNLFGPLVPDWFHAQRPVPSQDGQVVAIARTRVAWVLVDTDRDWGSEVLLLKLNPLGVVTTLKTGKGGIRALVVDHRSGATRLVGFWKDHWHDLRWEEGGRGKWQESETW
jgi:hypothetical protein